VSDVGGTVNPVPASFIPTPQTGLRSDPTAAYAPDQTNADPDAPIWLTLPP